MRTYTALGVMSGSSLDGLDLALCELNEGDGAWKYRILDARTNPYSAEFQARLVDVMQGSALDLARLHRDLGKLIGEASAEFLNGRKVDLIASHGHSIFHKPDEGLTTQVGCGAHIAAITGTTTVCDFRTMDVAFGGQGAPLVPLGEKLLFPEHKAFLNIGGICNISLHATAGIIGYDVCIGNQALNFLAEEAGQRYDEGGALARYGHVHQPLLNALNALPFHHLPPPRSLGREWFDAELRPLLSSSTPLPDRMRTVVEHIAQQVGTALANASGPVLITGGGAFSGFLVERIRACSPVPCEIPDRSLVEYKEALVFALLGVLRKREEPNALSSVTGARRDAVCGSVHFSN